MDRERIDPESRAALDALLAAVPGGFNAIADIVERRVVLEQLRRVAAASQPPVAGVVIEDRLVPGPAGAADIALRFFRPAKAGSRSLPCVYSIHGGGMVLGSIDGDDPINAMLCTELDAEIVSVGYRLAPEHPYPAAVDDCYAGLQWIAGNAPELGVDPARLAVFGRSAGGGLAIAIAMMSRDREGPAIRFLAPIYPMLDDRNDTASSREITDIGIWDRAANLEAWRWYLGGRPADAYAAPARANDLGGLPPTFLDVGEIDLFRDEVIAFAARLLHVGVSTELHVYPGAYHASEVFAPGAALSRDIWQRRIAALRRALRGGVPT